MRLKATYKNETGSRIAKVYSNPEWEEHVVKFYKDGKHQTKADHHSDKEDAHSTAKSWVNEPMKESIEINEISKGLVNNYLKKNMANTEKKTPRQFRNRVMGYVLAKDKLKKKSEYAKIPATNESIVTLISQNNLVEAEKLFKEQMFVAVKKKLLEHKKMMMSELVSEEKDKEKERPFDGSDGTWTDESIGPDDKRPKDKKKSWVQKFKDKINEDKPKLEVVPPKKRTPSEIADGMSNYQKSGKHASDQIGKPEPRAKQWVRIVK